MGPNKKRLASAGGSGSRFSTKLFEQRFLHKTERKEKTFEIISLTKMTKYTRTFKCIEMKTYHDKKTYLMIE